MHDLVQLELTMKIFNNNNLVHVKQRLTQYKPRAKSDTSAFVLFTVIMSTNQTTTYI